MKVAETRASWCFAMGGRQFKREGRISKGLGWAKSNWQILLFWFACAFAGWYLGAKGYGMALYFRITGINPEEWIPILRLAAEKDPRVGIQVSLDGLTDWEGKPLQLPYREKNDGCAFHLWSMWNGRETCCLL